MLGRLLPVGPRAYIYPTWIEVCIEELRLVGLTLPEALKVLFIPVPMVPLDRRLELNLFLPPFLVVCLCKSLSLLAWV